MKAGAKMKVLFATDSAFQLITAINLRMTVYQDAEADIIIYNSTNNAEAYCENLRQTGVFSRCWCAKTPLTYCGSSYSIKEKLPKYFVYLKSLLWPETCIKRILGESLLHYDHFIFNGTGALPDCIFNVCQGINPEIECFRIEDSYVSYTLEYGKEKGRFRNKLEHLCAKILGRKNLVDSVKGYYLMAPELVGYDYPYPVIKVPKLSRENKQLISVLNKTFAYSPNADDFHERFIFFEGGESYFLNYDGDLEYVEKLEDIVGGKNVLVKQHPRTLKDRYEGFSVRVLNGVGIPWEVIQLNLSIYNKVLITIKSSAVLSSEIYFGDSCEIILLYKAASAPGATVSPAMEKCIQKLKSNSKNRYYMPESMEEFSTIIKALNK